MTNDKHFFYPYPMFENTTCVKLSWPFVISSFNWEHVIQSPEPLSSHQLIQKSLCCELIYPFEENIEYVHEYKTKNYENLLEEYRWYNRITNIFPIKIKWQV